MAENDEHPRKRLVRSHSNFASHTAEDEQHQLDRRWSLFSKSSPRRSSPAKDQQNGTAQEQGLNNDVNEQSYFSGFSGLFNRSREASRHDHRRSSGSRSRSRDAKHGTEHGKLRARSAGQPLHSLVKLGTFAGVFVPTTLNVLSILMFLRFGFILGQSGVLGMMGMLVACYAINLLTTMSVSAIASNGQVRGGGAYYLISRSLGPEFGGSIGIVFYVGCVLNTGMNAVGLIDCLKYNFGVSEGNWAKWLPDDFWWSYLWATVVLVLCTAICLAGSSLFAKASNGLLLLLLIATFSIPISTLFIKPYVDEAQGIRYTGLSMYTLKGNLLPRFTKGADGSQLRGKETWQDLFGILFPATGGIFAGASMSGDLKHPSKAIPKGTLYGLLLTFFTYTIVILALAATVTRASFYRNVNVIQEINVSVTLILLGEFATSFFSALMGVIGSAKLLQALARDKLLTGLSMFGQGTKTNDEPTYAIILTYLIAQVTMLADINSIASFVTMTYLMTFFVTNLACFLLKIGSAPNFRPSFHYFNWQTASIGAVVSVATMFFVDGYAASGSVVVLILLFVFIHYTTPPKSWGDVSQSLIYHQVRKYLLRLRDSHIKFWRPSILLLVNDPRRQYKLIQFCNSLKKGGLFVLGHVIVTEDFAAALPEAKRQHSSWMKYIDFSRIKAFVNVAISPGYEWGARNIVLNAGLGGMKPNIVVMGFFNLGDLRVSQTLIDVPSPQPSRPSTGQSRPQVRSTTRKRREDSEDNRWKGNLPTDTNRPEGAISAKSYVTILEDLLIRLQINVAIAKGFQQLDLPPSGLTKLERLKHWLTGKSDGYGVDDDNKYIDLWPIQMSAEISAEGDDKQTVLTTNFDTYTLILQLGCILDTVRSWERGHTLRVSVFVEYESDVEEERSRVTSLLYNLRIEAEVRVFHLSSGDLSIYEAIVNGKQGEEYIQSLEVADATLEDEDWWQEMKKTRASVASGLSAVEELAEMEGTLDLALQRTITSLYRKSSVATNLSGATGTGGLRRIMHKARRRQSISGLSTEMSMQTSGLDPSLVERFGRLDSSSESSTTSEDEEDYDRSDGDEEFAVDGSDLDSLRSPDSTGGASRLSRSLGDRVRERLFGPRFVSFEGRRDSSAHANGEEGFHATAGADVANSATASTSRSPNALTPLSPHQTPSKTPLRPSLQRLQSQTKFSSRPVPVTTFAQDEGAGRSIMFAEPSTPPNDRARQSIYARTARDDSEGQHPTSSHMTSGASASGYPSLPSVPLTFNDLPCRAQHLILNELMVAQSKETAVLFTTLPSPVSGTGESEEDSVRYLADLEVLCQDLPPTLLLHSNSITVTMNL